MTDQHPEHQPPTVEKMTGGEVANSLTGFDEIAIKKAFGASLDQLDAITVARACGFTLLRREGRTDQDAYHGVMSMPQTGLRDLFADEPDDEDDRDPFAEPTAAGKEQPPSGPTTTS